MRPPDRPLARRALALGLAIRLLAPASAATRADEPPDPEDLRPGLVVEFRASAEQGGVRLPRIVPTIVDRWADGVPDPRMPAGGFRASWHGWLLIREPGPHRVRIDSDGPFRFRLGPFEFEGPGGAPIVSDELPMRVGLVPLRFSSEHRGDDRRAILDWTGPGFGWERLPASRLFHEAAETPAPDPFEIGRQLADRVGCANCHDIPSLTPRPAVGPPLRNVHSLRPDWLIDWIADPTAIRPGTPMPGFGLDHAEAADLAAYLADAADRPAPPGPEARMALNLADAGRGRLLFRSAGCLGCHPDGGEEPPASIRFGPDLSGLGAKRSLDAVARYLAGASRSTPGSHRPELGLTPDAAAHLAAYLTQGAPADRPEPGPTAPGDPVRGKLLARSIGCVSCHEMPGADPFPRPDAPLARGSDVLGGCLADDPPAGVPRFGFDDEQRRALRAFLDALPPHAEAPPPWDLARDALRRHQCFGCHAREGQGGDGIGPRLARLLAEDRELNALKGTLTPPDLSSVGAKLRPEFLGLAVRGQAPTSRPWLSVRMPRSDFEPGEAEAIAAFLREVDRVAHPPTPDEPAPPPAPAVEVGIRLLGRDGFGCLSCHVLDGKIPPGGEAETLGPDLALAHRRMERPYFDRWLADPQRILPGTAMPQFLLPVPGVEGTVAEQLGAVWEALGDPRLAELSSTAARQFLVRQGDRPLVVRDMVVSDVTPQAHYPRAVAIGLTGERSLLFDADRLSWILWWDGGFLSRTKQGRLWEWHPEGRTLWVADAPSPPVLFRRPDGAVVPPDEQRERFGSFSELAFEANGVRMQYLLNGPHGARVRVTEHLAPTDSGWRRRVELDDVPEGLTPVVLAASGASWDLDGRRASLVAEGAEVEIRLGSDGLPVADPADAAGPRALLIEPSRLDDGRWAAEIRVDVAPEAPGGPGR